MAERRERYTRDFKTEAVRLLESSGRNGREIEKELEIGSGQIYRWRKQLRRSPRPFGCGAAQCIS